VNAAAASIVAAAAFAFAASAAPAADPDLTPTEQRWLAGVKPVVAWALQQHLPLEITVLPQARAGDAPLALGYADGHCELVFAMRGNPEAQRTLADIPPAILQPTLEAMAAHEIGHCWRHRDGAFSHLPAGFVDAPDAIEARQPTDELRAMARDMRVARREEAFADLVGLAWTAQRHAQDYPAVLAWFDRVRADDTERGFHDTRHWLALARDPGAFSAGADAFAQATVLWRRGLADD
jgi:hypothetical protein